MVFIVSNGKAHHIEAKAKNFSTLEVWKAFHLDHRVIDIGSHYFKKKSKKENQPAKTDRLMGKFDGVEALESALRSLAARMDIPEKEVEQQIGKLGLPTAYRRLQTAFSGRKQKANI